MQKYPEYFLPLGVHDDQFFNNEFDQNRLKYMKSASPLLTELQIINDFLIIWILSRENVLYFEFNGSNTTKADCKTFQCTSSNSIHTLLTDENRKKQNGSSITFIKEEIQIAHDFYMKIIIM